MITMNQITWDQPINPENQPHACCIKLSIGVSKPVENEAE